MQKIAVEEEHVARIHLNVGNRKTLEDCGNAFRKLLLQLLEATSKEDIDALYEAIVKGKVR